MLKQLLAVALEVKPESTLQLQSLHGYQSRPCSECVHYRCHSHAVTARTIHVLKMLWQN